MDRDCRLRQQTAPQPPRDGEHMSSPSNSKRRLIHVTCSVHRGPAGFANLVVRKLDGQIELDPHVTGACVLLLDEDGARLLHETLGDWLG